MKDWIVNNLGIIEMLMSGVLVPRLLRLAVLERQPARQGGIG